jgi:hypothetical protein
VTLIHKAEVGDGGVAREIWYAVGVANALRLLMMHPDMVVTSMRDGKHMEGSLHASGHAVDLRTHDLSPEAAREWARRVAKFLDEQGFDVVLEISPPHLHIEFDPKPGEHFWTVEA